MWRLIWQLSAFWCGIWGQNPLPREFHLVKVGYIVCWLMIIEVAMIISFMGFRKKLAYEAKTSQCNQLWLNKTRAVVDSGPKIHTRMPRAFKWAPTSYMSSFWGSISFDPPYYFMWGLIWKLSTFWCGFWGQNPLPRQFYLDKVGYIVRNQL